MAVLPVSSVKFNSSRVNFGNIREEEDEVQEQPRQSSSIGKKLAVPVIVLMAMNPSLLQAQDKYVPNSNNELNDGHFIELVAKPYTAPEADYDFTLVGNKYDYLKWPCFDRLDVKMVRNATGNNSPYYMVYTSYLKNRGKSVVNEVYFVKKEGNVSNSGADFPPRVEELIYHDIGKDEYCGVLTRESMIDSNGERYGYLIREIRIDDDNAREMVKLLQDESKYKNETKIKMSKTYSKDLTERKIIYNESYYK